MSVEYYNGTTTKSFEFKDGKIEVSGEVQTEGMSDNEFFDFSLNSHETWILYLRMKKYYDKEFKNAEY